MSTWLLSHRTSHAQVVKLEGPFEIVSLVGTVSAAGSCHLHASLADKDGRVIGGHVVGDMVIFTTAEVVLGECIACEFSREMDDETGFAELTVHPRKVGTLPGDGDEEKAGAAT